MRTTLLLPGALVEEADCEAACRPLGSQAETAVMRRLQRARRSLQRFEPAWSDGAAHLAWLAAAFEVPGDPPATAPYAWRALGGDPARDAAGEPFSQVWFCEPVNLLPGRDRTILTPIERPELTTADCDRLAKDADEATRQAGARLEVRGGRWFLLTREAWSLDTVPLQAALGASVEARLPRGRDAARYRRLLNDIQMSWHASPVNAAREAAGAAPANGVWLHGGGTAQALQTRVAASSSGRGGLDPVLAGWAAAGTGDPASRIVVCDALFDPWWRKDWDAWARAWSTVAADAGEAVACGRRACARFTSPTPLRWLRPRSIRECLIERS